MAEIASWSTLAPDKRRAVVGDLERRKAEIMDRERRSRGHRLPGS
jgi:predicted Fe-S protein YdhL (DUF1289 family)